jgi:hypothetical protein
MQIDKETVLNFLRERGEHDKAEQAAQELPEQVDTERDSGLLARFGIDPSDLIGKVAGGRDIPGL